MTTTQEQRYLTFSLGAEEYAIPLLSVREVMAVPEITPMPFTPSYFLGLMNLRGQVISIIDLRHKLGIKPVTAHENGVIICEMQAGHLGILVDSVNAVVTPGADAITSPPEVTGSLSLECVAGVFRHQEKLILLIDLEKTLSGDDRKAMSANKSVPRPSSHKVA
ncbi:MAG: purine-binding chemotaxis protein CheW [Bdellovibrio sp.]|nr:purine-binding chemotaxis protein CheW [Bdellovibrio sp.]